MIKKDEYNVDFDKFVYYLSEVNINLTESSKKMLYNDLVMMKTGSTVKNIHIKDFPHSEVCTKNEKNIEEYEVPEFIQVFALENGVIGPKAVTRWSIHKNLKMFKVKLQSNKETVASDDHSLICFNPKTGLVDKIKPEESVGLLTPIPAKLEMPKPEKTKSSNEGYFIGAITGDGWANNTSGRAKNAIMLASTEPAIGDKISEFLNKKAYIISNTHDFDGHEANSTKYTWADKKWAQYIRDNIKCGAVNKQLPLDFINCGEKYAWGILSGLIDTDGTVCKVHPKAKKHPQYQCGYDTISSELKTQICQLAAFLGIRTSVTPYKAKSGSQVYRLSLSMVDVVKYKDEFMLQHSHKKQILEEANVSKDDKDIVPISFALAETLQKYIDHKKDKSLYSIVTQSKKAGTMLRSSAIRLAKAIRLQDDDYKAWKTEFVYNRNFSREDFNEVLEQIKNYSEQIQSFIEKEEFSPNEIK